MKKVEEVDKGDLKEKCEASLLLSMPRRTVFCKVPGEKELVLARLPDY